MRSLVRRGSSLALALGLVALAADRAPAQFCAGFPTVSGQSSLGGIVGFPTAATSWGVEGSLNMAGPLAVFGNVALMTHDSPNVDNTFVVGGGLAYDISDFVALPPTFSLCPVVGLTFGSQSGTTSLDVPIGMGLGAQLGVEGGPMLMPYVLPQFIWTRISGDGVSFTDTNFGIEAGFLAQFGAFYAGVTGSRIFATGRDVDFAIRAGLTFGVP